MRALLTSLLIGCAGRGACLAAPPAAGASPCGQVALAGPDCRAPQEHWEDGR